MNWTPQTQQALVQGMMQVLEEPKKDEAKKDDKAAGAPMNTALACATCAQASLQAQLAG